MSRLKRLRTFSSLGNGEVTRRGVLDLETPCSLHKAKVSQVNSFVSSSEPLNMKTRSIL